jgi:hypothetical protein
MYGAQRRPGRFRLQERPRPEAQALAEPVPYIIVSSRLAGRAAGPPPGV